MTEHTYRTNDEVTTPIGAGVVQGSWVDGRWLVRVAVSGSVTDSRCFTPKATKSSLWLFTGDELKSRR